MFSNKNSIIFLLAVSLLVGGLIAGYSIGVSRLPVPQEIVCNNFGNNSPGKIKAVKTDLTAKEAYNIALSESRSWPEDAYLSEIELNSKKFDEKGFSNGWKVVFYSKSKNKIYEVTIKDGESRGTIEKDASLPLQTLKGEMIDSSSLAKVFFELYPVNTEVISLRMYYDESNKKFIWTVFFSKGSHTIDAEI